MRDPRFDQTNFNVLLFKGLLMKLMYFFLILVSMFLNLKVALGCGCGPAPDPAVYCECETVSYYGSYYCGKTFLCHPIVNIENVTVCQNYTVPKVIRGSCQLAFDTITDQAPPLDSNGPSCASGSIVKIENRSLQENIPLVGSDLDLVYSTERMLGRKEKLRYTQFITQPTDTNVTEVFVKHTVDGIMTDYNFPVTSDINYNYLWNGLNALSQEVISGVNHKIEVEYEFNNTNRTKIYETLPQISFFNSRLLGLGGFTLSNLHFYNLKLNKVHFGNGYDRIIDFIKINKTGDVIEKLLSDATSFTHYMVVSEDGLEAYIFDTLGYHIETRSTRTSKVLTTFSYDGSKRLTQIQDAFANQTNVTRPNSTTVVITTPSLKATTLTLNAQGFATQILNPNAEDYLMSYSAVVGQKGLMLTFETPKGLISTFTYDSEGRLINDSNNAGQSVGLNVLDDQPNYKLIQAISAEGRITQYYTTLLPYGHTNSNTTKPSGSLTSENNQDASYTKNNPDSSSLSVQRTLDPRFDYHVYTDTSTSNYSHQVIHQIDQVDNFVYADTDILKLTDHTKTVTYDLKNWVTDYDPTLQTYTSTTPLSRTQKIKYNNFDQVVEEKYASFLPVAYTYDVKGRLDLVTQSTRVWDYTYNTEYEVQSLKNPLNQTTSYVYDNNGRVIESTYPNLEKAYFEYDEVGNMKRIKGGTKPWHDLVYTLFGELSDYIMPNLGSGVKTVQYDYNNDKQLTKITRENLSEITFAYGLTTGVLEQITAPEGNYIYTTNLTTDQTDQIKAPNNIEINYTYLADVLQIQGIKDGVNNSTYRYDYAKMLPNKRTLRHQDSNSNVNHVTNITYNNDRLMTVVGAQTLTRTAATGLISATSLTGGMTEQYTYNASFGEVASYTVKYSTTQKFKEVYTRDALGRTTKRVETINASPATTHDYVYDTRGRLIEAKLASVIQRKYTYDSNSNRLDIKNAALNQLAVGTYNDQDQMLTYIIKNAGGTVLNNYTYTYDDFGNRLTKVDTTNNTREEYIYNSIGALTSYIKKNATTLAVLKTVTYQNDALGRRITKTEDSVLQTRYIYDESIRLVGEVTPNGDTLTHYVYVDKSHTPAYMSRAGVNYKFITNEQGSVRFVMLATTGVVQQEITYDEFGNITADTNPGFQPFGFAGGIYDPDTKLTRFGARDYDAEIGRWSAKDPIRFNGGDTNLYSYSIQDPINFIDPSGFISYPEQNGLPGGAGGPGGQIGGGSSGSFYSCSSVGRPARNLREQLTMQEAMSGRGKNIKVIIKDPRYQDPGWGKQQYIRTFDDGSNIKIHYMNNNITGQRTDFKFKD